MNNYIYMNKIESLKDDILDDGCEVVCLKRNVNGYFIHIICCQFSDEGSLGNNWEEFMCNVADFLQKKLTKLIEIYNIYIIFFEKGAEESIINKIEQNKYFARKIVLKEDMPSKKNDIEQILNQKLFDLEIEMENREKELFINDMSFLNTSDEEKRKRNFEKYIENIVRGHANEKNQ